MKTRRDIAKTESKNEPDRQTDIDTRLARKSLAPKLRAYLNRSGKKSLLGSGNGETL